MSEADINTRGRIWAATRRQQRWRFPRSCDSIRQHGQTRPQQARRQEDTARATWAALDWSPHLETGAIWPRKSRSDPLLSHTKGGGGSWGCWSSSRPALPYSTSTRCAYRLFSSAHTPAGLLFLAFVCVLASLPPRRCCPGVVSRVRACRCVCQTLLSKRFGEFLESPALYRQDSANYRGCPPRYFARVHRAFKAILLGCTFNVLPCVQSLYRTILCCSGPCLAIKPCPLSALPFDSDRFYGPFSVSGQSGAPAGENKQDCTMNTRVLAPPPPLFRSAALLGCGLGLLIIVAFTLSLCAFCACAPFCFSGPPPRARCCHPVPDHACRGGRERGKPERHQGLKHVCVA